jgi:hypothetical protein
VERWSTSKRGSRMSQFEYLSLLVSTIDGVAITRLLSGERG